MKIIVAVDQNWGIGNKNDLLFHIPEDLKRFKALTENNVVIIGKNTLMSLPNGKPLKNRINIVITSDNSFNQENVIIAHSIDESINIAKKYNKNIFIIGGASIYKQFLPLCNELYITKINDIKEADVFFPNVDELKTWLLVENSDSQTFNNVEYNFTKYMKIY